jgi:hypothetical protein
MTSYKSKRYRSRYNLGLIDDVLSWAFTGTYGYFAGGGGTAITDRITFSTGVTAANTISNLSANRQGVTGVSDKISYGYFGGGITSKVTDRIVFSTGATSANTVSNLSSDQTYLSGVSDGSTYGYFAGGITGGAPKVTTTNRIVFSSGTTAANTASNLSLARYGLAGISDGLTYGYFAGGDSNAVVATADRITFSTGATAANTVSNLSLARFGVTGISDGSTYGYFAGGDSTSIGDKVATADRIVFSTGATSANTVSNLSQARNGSIGSSDGSSYGYFAGGYTGSSSVVLTADRVAFSSGITSANTGSNLSQARGFGAGLSDGSI